MAEICLKCWNKLNESNYPKIKYIISKNFDLCEECGEWTHIIEMERRTYYLRKFRFVIFPFRIIFAVLLVIWYILFFPYLFYKHKKAEKILRDDIPQNDRL